MKRILLTVLVMFSVLQAGITFTSGSKVYIGNATLGVYGNITNNLVKDGSGTKLATIDFLPTSKVSFVGSSNDTITNIYAFPNILISKPSGSVRLNNNTGNFLLTGNINFVQGNLLTGTNTFELGSAATVTNETAARYIVGTVKSARVVGTGTSAGTGNFGGIGYTINDTGSNLGTVTVYRYTGAGTQETIFGSQGIMRKWQVETSVAFSGTRQVTTSWLSNEDNGNVLANLKVWKYVTSKGSGDRITEDVRISRLMPAPERAMSKGIIVHREYESMDHNETDDDFDYELNDGEEPKTLGWMEVTGASFSTGSSPRTATYTINEATVYTINDIANQFAGGAGTEANPYQIATLDQLNNVRNYLSAHFIQTADIDASPTSTWNSGAGWDPIGRLSPYFSGKYNGNGKTINGLYSDRPAIDYVGLFGRVTTGAEIKDLGIVNAYVSGRNYVAVMTGYSQGTMKTSYVQGVVYATGLRNGGFLGYSTTGGVVRNCFADVEVTRSSGSSSTDFGGFCGRLFIGEISNSYSTGAVIYEGTTNPANKGFAGSAGTTITMTGNFWNIQTSGQTTTGGTATGLTTNQMRTLSIFTNAGWDFQGESVNGTENIWGISATEHAGFPFLSWQGITHNPSPFAGGIGTSDEPFLVSNLTQLDAVRNFLSYNFLQTADIDASATSTWDAGAGWLPIGRISPYFSGVYNGNGHTISNLYVNRQSTQYVGLFGYTTFTSAIRDLGIENASVTGWSDTAIFVGRSDGLIENCYTKGSVYTTGSRVGGFLGYSAGTSGVIRNCYSDAEITRLDGNLETVNLGGFCGRLWRGQIDNSYSTGAIIYENASDPADKGFLGAQSGGSMSNSFWNTDTSGQSSTAGNATGLTSAQMRTKSIFTNAGWDFVAESVNGTEDIWNIHTSLNSGYPYLNWEYRIPVEAPSNLALTVGATNVTITWDPVTGATGYIVYSSSDPYGVFGLDETGGFNGTEWTAPLNGSKMFYYVAAVNDTKVENAKFITVKQHNTR